MNQLNSNSKVLPSFLSFTHTIPEPFKFQNIILNKVREIKNEICVICLENVCSPVKPNNCSHIFCRRCFEVYTQKFSFCPTCKKAFTKYDDIFEHKIGKSEIIKKENYESEDKIYRLSYRKIGEDYCIICHKKEDKDYLIRCDRCFINQVHYYCDNFEGLAFGKYICPICRSRFYNHLKK